jgi:thiosulfate reductase cytochrome b subunit
MREYQLEHGVDRAGAYQTVLHLMAALLVVAFVAHLMVRSVAQKYWLLDGIDQGVNQCGKARTVGRSARKGVSEMARSTNISSALPMFAAWLLVALPLAWGVYNPSLNSMSLFRGQ